ncbi:MAG TPA: alpha/beta fold hydrolase [Gaiellaceae bacterium]|nr:alpha/beta fold hydrolase [Gaiellaceae bacterium]
MPLVSGTRRVAGLRVHEVASPARPGLTVVGIHGLGVSTRHLRPILEALAPHRRVVALDLPGFGRSERPPRALGVETLATVVRAWLAGIGVGRGVLLGNSMGCQVAVEVAVRWPALVDRLVLVGPTRDPAAPTLARQLARLALDSTRESARLNGVVASDYLRAGPVRTARAARAMVRHPIERRLPLVQAPVLVVRGSRDPIAPAAWAEHVAALAPAGRAAVVPGAAHAAHFTHPEALRELVLPFLREDAGEPARR